MVSKERHAGLGDNVVPENYEIRIEPNLKTFVFEGSETIEVMVKRSSKDITLNVKDLKVKSALVSSAGKKQTARIAYSKRKEEVLLLLDKPVAGRAVISIVFEGVHNDKMYGFYRSKYNYNGKDDYIVSTQFEAPDARAAFPCFDEPSFKATFDLTLVVDEGLEAISNMPVKSKRRSGRKYEVEFMRTPKMSTYLLFMAVGRFEYLSTKRNNLLMRAVTTSGKKDNARLALQYTVKFVDFYEKYFGIKYPLPKLDIIAIPDFAAGAMENWGAITFREIAMLGNSKSAAAVKRNIAVTVAHELAHQWFGDLVTMWWWDDLWLNESFATFMSYKAISAVFPSWKMDIEYITDVVTSALAADALKSTHPVSVKVDSPQKIDEIFDAISYDKGGTILMMLEDYVGVEVFRKGLHDYLKKYSYSNATKYDLWGEIDFAARKAHAAQNVSRIASQWLNEKGYPIIRVEKNGEHITLSQKRFTLEKDMNMLQPRLIPVHYMDSAGKERKVLVSKSLASIETPMVSWVKLNLGQRALYRVAYPESMLSEIGMQIKAGGIKGLDAWGILNDLFALTRSSRIGAIEFLEFIEKYCDNAAYPLNKDIFGWLGWLHTMTRGSELQRRVELHMLFHGKRAMAKIALTPKENEDISVTELRNASLSALGMVGDRSTVAIARKLLSAQFKSGKEMASNIRSTVYTIVARNGGSVDYDRFVKMRKADTPPDEDHYLLAAISSFSEKGIVKQALEYSLSEKVRLQDAYIIPTIASSTDAGADLAWPWIKENWSIIMKKIPPSTHLLERFVSPLSVVRDRTTLKEIKEFFSKRGNKRGDITKEYAETVERIEANIRFMERNHLS
ncbi:MAG: M1 family metallopeptidase [Candidatus Marsarchaeota archaeon]|nr:M1 family metallopeptidase [Candidatus Marsarchaeota archaeon]